MSDQVGSGSRPSLDQLLVIAKAHGELAAFLQRCPLDTPGLDPGVLERRWSFVMHFLVDNGLWSTGDSASVADLDAARRRAITDRVFRTRQQESSGVSLAWEEGRGEEAHPSANSAKQRRPATARRARGGRF